MKVYTGAGDEGKSNINGKSTPKDAPMLKAIGAVDELNSNIGFVRSLLGSEDSDIDSYLKQIQEDLFQVGGAIANPNFTIKLNEDRVKEIEKVIDGFSKDFEFNKFVFPTGCESGAALHVARTVCRRVESEIVTYNSKEKVNPIILKYINRLSDFLFTLALVLNSRHGIIEEEFEI
jgi:cob(I)alamin adenosyltransferase